ncbi:MAG: hypothetical protein B6A08_07020 [Sorangiineae bacterium NIC37A_2]|jgi:hypothetical protein|nr:MAG: hypothetical protein B6A08_07020 [Sorangiineae bacterium NIC37A_2]
MMKKLAATVGAALGVLAQSGCAVAPMGEDEMALELMSEDVGSKEALNSSCYTLNGLHPLKASLAVSMAREMGRIDPLADLSRADRVVISWKGYQRCAERGHDGCPNTSAILDLQLSSVNQYIDQNTFNATNFREDLKASFDRQSSWEHNLRLNSPWLVPQEHTLTQKGTFTQAGACGVHFEFFAQGNAIQNIKERLVFFGGDQNPFIAFQATRTTIAIDPTGTMNGDSGTSSGSQVVACTSTNMNLKNKACTCDRKSGKLKVAPWNLKTLYCAT